MTRKEVRVCGLWSLDDGGGEARSTIKIGRGIGSDGLVRGNGG